MLTLTAKIASATQHYITLVQMVFKDHSNQNKTNRIIEFCFNGLSSFQYFSLGFKDVAELLIEHGSDVNYEGNESETPLYNAVFYGNSNSFHKI